MSSVLSSVYNKVQVWFHLPDINITYYVTELVTQVSDEHMKHLSLIIMIIIRRELCGRRPPPASRDCQTRYSSCMKRVIVIDRINAQVINNAIDCIAQMTLLKETLALHPAANSDINQHFYQSFR